MADATETIVNKSQGIDENGAKDGFKALGNVITKEQLKKAVETLKKYKDGKTNLETKIIENEQWYKLRHWECMRDKKKEAQPTSAWLFNCIANKHADAMDNYPMPNIRPREEGDKSEAKILSSIIPVILDRCEYEQVYSDVWMYKLKTGTGCYGVFWDAEILDITIKKVDLLNLFWEPGITDIQQSRNLFSVELVDNDILTERYPQLKGKLGSGTIDIAEYNYDDKVDTTEKSAVVDWYYHKLNANGQKILHYCKFVNDEVLFATENNSDSAYENGWYAHGMYPFVFDVLYPFEGTPAGFGYIDIGKDAQAYIDRGNQILFASLAVRGKPRWMVRNDGGVNEDELMDLTKDVIHCDGNLGEDTVRALSAGSLGSINEQIVQDKIVELKETTGNRDVSTGGSTAGVTAASAIAAMQEAGSKLSRDNIKASYRAYSKMIYMVIELIRQFYDMPRQFRIVGEQGAEEFVTYSNANIQPQSQGDSFGVDLGYRIPQFDIEVTAQKQSPYTKMSQNELALQFFGAGFFNPQIADQALACLDMMDFDRKQFVVNKIKENAMIYQQTMAMINPLAMLQGGIPTANDGGVDKKSTGGEESSITENARQRTAAMTAPR